MGCGAQALRATSRETVGVQIDTTVKGSRAGAEGRVQPGQPGKWILPNHGLAVPEQPTARVMG